MKLNRILSTVLVIVMLVTGMLATFPFSASAAAEDEIVVSVNKNSVEKSEEEILAIVKAFKEKPKYDSVEDMLAAENPDYLDSITLGDSYVLFINRYTGVVYYKNNASGEIIVSNPYDSASNVKSEVLGQITIGYATKSKPTDDRYEYSFECINEGSFISVEKYGNNSIKVTYYLGEPESVHRVPDSIYTDDMGEEILKPMFNKLEQMLNEYIGEYNSSDEYISKLKANGTQLTSYNPYRDQPEVLMFSGDLHNDMIKKVATAISSYAMAKLGKSSPKYKEINKFTSNITRIFNEYKLYNPDILADGEEKEDTVKIWAETVPGFKTENGYKNVFVLDNTEVDQLKNSYRLVGKALKENLDFSREKADELNAKTGFTPLIKDLAVFECALIYTLDKDGSLVVDFPVSSLKYDQETFILKSVSYLQYFGYGNMNDDGYIFYPDGSGTIIDFNDFNKQNVQIGGDVYGRDFCYATIVDKHREQITMPVFGVVSTMQRSGSPAVMGGYFAVIEEGASISYLRASTGGGYHDYATAYSEFTPLSYDTVDLADVVSVGNSSQYIVVAETGYTGSHKTRYVQLTDPALAAEKGMTSYYETSYIGMANYYRDYLKNRGILEKLKNTEEKMPLYIETLGAIDVTQRILTFPVAVSTPLTTFEDVQTMYNELSAKGITNINFRLTGFSNGGMYFTYPAKVRWESSLGGEDGFVDLLSYASSKSNSAGYNFGVYPDFDFQYINNTAMFDRVSNSANGSKFVDNRYATKQVYDSVSGLYETVYSVLVSANTLDELYDDFIDDYSEYSAKGISVSTLGSDLNSNFDDDNTVDREASRKYVEALLGRMKGQNGYSVMTDVANSYTYKYIDHILNATIDSSHLTQSSYAVPFFGMVLHGYVNYAGTPLNYTGSIDYNLLKSIENGAALYYILCMQNTNYLKDDINLSKYYGVDYKNWFDSIIESYNVLNSAIGNLQKYEIVNHTTLIAERIPNPSEYADDVRDLLAEFADEIDKQIAKEVSAKLAEMRDNAQWGVGLSVNISKAEIIAAAIENFSYDADGTNKKLTESELSAYGFTALIDGIISKYENRYPAAAGAEVINFNVANVSYDSKFTYSSDSLANSGDAYIRSDYTSDNGSVIAVTYKDTDPKSSTYGDTVVFLINYNNYEVKVTIDGSVAPYLSEQKTYTVGKVGFIKV